MNGAVLLKSALTGRKRSRLFNVTKQSNVPETRGGPAAAKIVRESYAVD